MLLVIRNHILFKFFTQCLATVLNESGRIWIFQRRHLPPTPPLSEHHDEENQADTQRGCRGNKTGASHPCFIPAGFTCRAGKFGEV